MKKRPNHVGATTFLLTLYFGAYFGCVSVAFTSSKEQTLRIAVAR